VTAKIPTTNVRTSNLRRFHASKRAVPGPRCDVSYLGRPPDWHPRDELTRLPVTSVRRRSLSPTRKLALKHIEAQKTPESREYQAVKCLTSGGGRVGGTGREVVVYKAHSVLDVDRLRRRADRRRDEVALHLVSHDPSSALFRAALSPMLPSYQLAPRLPSV